MNYSPLQPISSNCPVSCTFARRPAQDWWTSTTSFRTTFMPRFTTHWGCWSSASASVSFTSFFRGHIFPNNILLLQYCKIWLPCSPTRTQLWNDFYWERRCRATTTSWRGWRAPWRSSCLLQGLQSEQVLCGTEWLNVACVAGWYMYKNQNKFRIVN